MPFEPTSIDEKTQVPSAISLFDCYPNPFNTQSSIHYVLAKPGNVSVEIFNVLGEKVATIVNDRQSAGYHQASWNAGDMSSGVYFYKIQSGDFNQTRKMSLLK